MIRLDTQQNLFFTKKLYVDTAKSTRKVGYVHEEATIGGVAFHSKNKMFCIQTALQWCHKHTWNRFQKPSNVKPPKDSKGLHLKWPCGVGDHLRQRSKDPKELRPVHVLPGKPCQAIKNNKQKTSKNTPKRAESNPQTFSLLRCPKLKSALHLEKISTMQWICRELPGRQGTDA